jgi:transposase-like protein
MYQNGTPTTALPDPEVRPKAQHRQFSAEYKKRILDESDACTTPTERGALARREGLYSSHLTAWHRQLYRGHRHRTPSVAMSRTGVFSYSRKIVTAQT